jgi:8-oxo-dGTP pyrophosphatase MutT (NUDIX family)
LIHYALCYCIYNDELVLIEKNKPDWQKGKLNLPGGKVEENESPMTAAVRELKEETNLVYVSVSKVGKIIGNGCEVHVFFGFGRGTLRQLTDEKLHLVRALPAWDKAELARFIPNLQLIIPLIKAAVEGWTLTDLGNGDYTFRLEAA